MDETQFKTFYEATAPGLWAYVMKLTGHRELTDDILQDAYVRWNLRVPSELTAAAQRSYLYRIATNLVTDDARRNRRIISDDAAVHQAEARPIDIALTMDIDNAFSKLSDQNRALLWLAYAEDYTHEEIGDILNVKTGSVKVLLHRARKKLSEILDQIEFRRTS